MNAPIKRLALAGWIFLIAGFALVHFLHLGADFPNHTEWYSDWAKYTDEGWYGNAAIRAHLFGNWYMPGDFNPAPAVPVWPFLEWVLFFFTGVSVVAVRALVVTIFVVNLALSYLLLRGRGGRWVALLALTLLCTSPFLYAFSRLAILEPLLTTFFLAALNLAVRLPRFKRPMVAASAIGLLFALMLLTKTSAAFLLPGLIWAMLAAFASADPESGSTENAESSKALAALARGGSRCAGGWRGLGGFVRAVDGLCRLARAAGRLPLPVSREQMGEAQGVLLAGGELLVVVSRRTVDRSHSRAALRNRLPACARLLAVSAAGGVGAEVARRSGLRRVVALGGWVHPLYDLPEPSAAALLYGGSAVHDLRAGAGRGGSRKSQRAVGAAAGSGGSCGCRN